MASSLRLRAAGAILAAALLAPSIAQSQSAEDRATARMLATDADKKLSAKDYKGAFDLFKKAFSLVPAPTIKLEMGRAKVQLGELVEAQQHFLEASRLPAQPGEPPSFAQARDTAAKEAAALTPRIATLEVGVEGPPADKVRVTVDDTPLRPELLGLPRALNPGAHTIKAEADGYKTESRSVTLAEAEKQKLTITLTKDVTTAPPPASSAPIVAPPPTASSVVTPPPAAGAGSGKTLAIVGFVSGGVFLAVGGITGIMSKSKVDDVKTRCNGTSCLASDQSNADTAKTLGWISTGGFALGAVGVAVGIYGLVAGSSAPKESASSDVRFGVGPRSVAVEGRF